MDKLTQCPRCGEQSVHSKTVFFREVNANMKQMGKTETVLEKECQRCGWMTSEPAPASVGECSS